MKGHSLQLNDNTFSQGFSLIELLVSVAIFAIVVTMSIGALMVVIDANAKAQNMQEVMVGLTFVMDSISREVRTGEGFYCSDTEPSGTLDEQSTRDCASGGVYLSLVEGDVSSSLVGTGEPRITYWFNQALGRIDRRVGNGSFYPITSEAVTVTDARFYVSDSDGALDGDVKQANATIYMAGEAGAISSADTSFQLQTTVAKRILDI